MRSRLSWCSPWRQGAVALLALSFVACGGKEVRPEGDAGTPDAGPDQAQPCAPVSLERNVDLQGFHTDRYTWRDGDCAPRSAFLVRNDSQDPAGWHH